MDRLDLLGKARRETNGHADVRTYAQRVHAVRGELTQIKSKFFKYFHKGVRNKLFECAQFSRNAGAQGALLSIEFEPDDHIKFQLSSLM